MKIFLFTIVFVFSIVICRSQENGVYYSYKSAVNNLFDVRVIDINCLHNDFYGNNSCGVIPDSITFCLNLTDFSTSEAQYKTLPHGFSRLSKLKSLSIEYNYSFQYKTELCKLVDMDSLQYLAFRKNSIYQLPECVAKLNNLRGIDLSFSDSLDLEHTFSLLSKLPRLESLNISGIRDINIPTSIVLLKSLKEIDVSWMSSFDHHALIDSIAGMKIERIKFERCGLSQLPSNITKLSRLKYISIGDNSLGTFPQELFSLSSIEEIKADRNSFSHIPSEIVKLKKLRKLDLGNNFQMDVSLTIKNLSALENLEELSFFNCKFNGIPVEIAKFKRLKKLNLNGLDDKYLVALFKNLAKVKALQYLDLTQVRRDFIKEKPLPIEVGMLTNLEYLILDENSGTSLTLPKEFFKLTKLKELHLAFVKLSDSQVKEIKTKLPNCKVVYEYGRKPGQK